MDKVYDGIDALIIGAHPDDAELSCGGTIAKLTKEGRKVAVVDCTAGEMGSRGTFEIREQEAKESSRILGITERINLGMRDGYVDNDSSNVFKLIEVIRRFRPKMLITHPPFERHPDHEAVSKLVRDAMFKSGLIKFNTEYNGEAQQVFRTNKIFCFMQSYEFQKRPDFYVDITDVHDIKMEAIRAFSSQVFVPGKYEDQPKTFLSSESFMEGLYARDRHFGRLIGTRYAEAFLSIESLGISSITKLID